MRNSSDRRIRETVTHFHDGIRHINVVTEWVLRRDDDKIVSREPVTASQPRVTLHVGMESVELTPERAHELAEALHQAASQLNEHLAQ